VTSPDGSRWSRLDTSWNEFCFWSTCSAFSSAPGDCIVVTLLPACSQQQRPVLRSGMRTRPPKSCRQSGGKSLVRPVLDGPYHEEDSDGGSKGLGCTIERRMGRIGMLTSGALESPALPLLARETWLSSHGSWEDDAKSHRPIGRVHSCEQLLLTRKTRSAMEHAVFRGHTFGDA
jgi:hypothetical protein